MDPADLFALWAMYVFLALFGYCTGYDLVCGNPYEN